MKFKQLGMMMAVSAALGAGAVTQAHASAAGQAEMSITNFILTSAGSTPLDISNFNSLSFLDTLSNTAQLGSAFDFKGANSGTFVPVVDALQACVGACASPQNNFVPAPVPPVTTYARSDSILAGAPISGTAVPVGVTANTIAETLINGTASGGSNSDITLTSSFNFTLAAASVVGVDFDASTFIRAWTSLFSSPPTSAGADFKWEITIRRGGTVIADWIPDGDTTTGTQTGLTVAAEDCNLSLNASAGPNEQQAPTTCSGHFTAHTTAALLGNTQYSLTIAQHVSSQAVAVPEPATLALLGLGLVGMGGFARKRLKS